MRKNVVGLVGGILVVFTTSSGGAGVVILQRSRSVIILVIFTFLVVSWSWHLAFFGHFEHKLSRWHLFMSRKMDVVVSTIIIILVSLP